MPSINSARYAQRIIQTESHESPSFLRKVHRLDPPLSDAPNDDLLDISNENRLRGLPHDGNCLKNETYISSRYIYKC